ncbi:hypothetical protein [Terriglobus aquaticus]|uniref:Uncharacterized protein n=1 Tax=Terriglobus aquaticus TaxID=940139 RepID=A0ABW9KKN6_9BACT|nr:hypothetical protein [Terriglobus aquaticus]
MIGFFIPIAEALFAGYIVAIGVYMAMLFLITRLGQRTFVQNSKVRPAYTALHAVVWGLAAFAGTYLCSTLSPLPPYGMLGFPLVLTIIFGLVILRSFRQLPGQMSALALLLNVGALLVGTYFALSVNKVFFLMAHLP